MFDTCPAKNLHPVEQVLRVLLGVVLLSLTLVGPKTDWGLLGLVPLMTGVSGRCPLYFLLDVNTRGWGKRRPSGG